METKKVRLTLSDGREVDYETDSFACAADRLALEARYNISSQALGEPGARETWILFLVWRTAVRSVTEFASLSFEDWIEQLHGYDFVDELSVVANPTEEAVPTR